MKKQTKTYILLTVVLGIWGFIGLKVVNTINPPAAKVKTKLAQAAFIPKAIKQRDTFSISANYRDPFLGTVYAPKMVKKATSKLARKTEEPEKNIAYTGFISDGSPNPSIFFVTVDGQQRMMALEDSFQEVKLISGAKSKIKVKINGRIKSISLTE